MRSVLAIGTLALGLLAWTAIANPATATPQSTATGASAKPCETCTVKGGPAAAANNAKPLVPPAGAFSAKSNGFWSDWTTTQASPDYTALKAAVDSAHAAPDLPTTAPAPADQGAPAPARQKIVDIAVTRPEAAARLLDAAPLAKDAEGANALKTIVAMATTPATLQAAQPLVQPDAQASAQAMTANLSTGIEGLPGIYLSDAPIEGSVRADVPDGYTPVAGSSMGCPSR